MTFKEKFILCTSCIRTILFKERIPVVVSWAITERCNLRCKYCDAWRNQSLELKTYQVLETIERLSRKGTKMIRFTGGEPLVRDDIATIINYSHDLGIYTTISTNGILFPDKIEEIKKIDGVSISLDGPKNINDAIRGTGSYKKTLQALETAMKKNIPVSISTTLNSFNLSSVEYMLHIARGFNARIFFQPATDTTLYGDNPNPISPEINRYREVILSLIQLKKRNKFIGNSMVGLKHLYYWPNKRSINCVAGKFLCRLDSQGNINPCGRFIIKNNRLNVTEKGVEHCFNKLYSPNCNKCWCSSIVELNLISDFNINAIINAIEM